MEKSRCNQMKELDRYGFSYASGNSQMQSSFAADAEYHGERNWLIGKASSTYSGQSDGTSTQRETLSGAYWEERFNQQDLWRFPGGPAQQQPAGTGPSNHARWCARKNTGSNRQD